MQPSCPTLSGRGYAVHESSQRRLVDRTVRATRTGVVLRCLAGVCVHPAYSPYWSDMAGRLTGLDGLRAVSILGVLVAHVLEKRYSWAHHGGFGVEVFFTISGFLITWLLCSEDSKNGSISIRQFYVRRALRILPPAFAFLSAVFVLGLFHLAEVHPGDVFYSAAFVRNILGTGEHTGHFWSLAIEEQFYLIWPTVFLLLGSNRKRLIFIASLVVIFPAWFYYRVHYGANPGAFDVRCNFLLAGCGLALARRDQRLSSWLSAPWSRHLLVPVIALLPLGLIRSPYLLMDGLVGTVKSLAVAAIINYAVQRRGFILDSKPLVWIGQLSYSLYLWQQVFCWHSQIPWLGSLPFNLLAATAAAAGSYYLIERPALRLRDRFMGKRVSSSKQPAYASIPA